MRRPLRSGDKVGGAAARARLTHPPLALCTTPEPRLSLRHRKVLLGTPMPPPELLHGGAVSTYHVQLRVVPAGSSPFLLCQEAVLPLHTALQVDGNGCACLIGSISHAQGHP